MTAKVRKFQPVVIVGLVISICIFWIVRAELHATALASRVDELHNSLKKNQDVLDYLDKFHRGVKNNSISIDGTTIELRSYLTAMGLTDKGITMQLDNSWFYLDNKGVAISRGKNNESILTVTDDGIKIKVGNKNDFFIEANSKGDNIILTKGDALLSVGKTSVAGKGGSSSLTGVTMGEANTGTISVAKGKGIGIATKDKNEIMLKVDDDFFVKLLPNEEQIVISKGDALLSVGKTSVTGKGGAGSLEGVTIGEAKTGTISVAKGKGVGIATKDKNDILLKVDDDFLVNLLPKQDQILLRKGDALIQLGKTSFGEGIALGEANTATIAIANGKGLAMKAGGKNFVKISGENDFFLEFEGSVNIKAKGDVNIKSEKGNINLKGKKINLNE